MYFLQLCLPLGPSRERIEKTKAVGITLTLFSPQFLYSEKELRVLGTFPAATAALFLWGLPGVGVWAKQEKIDSPLLSIDVRYFWYYPTGD